MKEINKIKDYWMATMAMDETREQMEEIWSTPEGMEDLMYWFDEELDNGLTEEDMNEAIATVAAHETETVVKEDKEMKNNEFRLNGVIYTQEKSGYCYAQPVGGIKKRIKKADYDKAWQENADLELAKQEEAKKAQAEADDKAVNAPAKKKARKSKDVAYTHKDGTRVVTLTAKQVDFIHHIPDTCFYEQGLDSTPWCDVLADEIGGQFEGKPMTVGAMISTLREKGIIVVGAEKMNGKKAKYFAFTEFGKLVAKGLGLH